MSVDGLQTVVMTDDHIFAIALGLVFHNADLTAESGTDGIADIDLDVKSLVLASPTGTEVGCHHAARRRHAETTEVDAERVGQGSLAMGIYVVPVLIEIGRGVLKFLADNQPLKDDGVNGFHLTVDGGLLG